MGLKLRTVPGGTITSPRGFQAGAAFAGMKTLGEDRRDLAILYSETPCTATGVFTSTKIKAAPVVISQKHLAKGCAQAIVANSGRSNAFTGEQGLEDAAEMAALTAAKLGLGPGEVLVASTGVTGVRLDMETIGAAIKGLTLSRQGGHDMAQAITTTDTFTKEEAIAFELGGREVTVGGIAKGAGMIHPDLCTLLCFLTTDAAVDGDFLRKAFRRVMAVSFNMLTIDGDTSPNDTVVLLANGVAGNDPIRGGVGAEAFQRALEGVCIHLAKCIARDGEGATKLIEVTVEGALTEQEARMAARTVASSPLVKTAVYGADPNWGRILAAVGRSGAEVVESKIDLFFDDICLLKGGTPLPFSREEARAVLSRTEVPIRIYLNLGTAKGTAWGCDLTEEYIRLNSAYTT